MKEELTMSTKQCLEELKELNENQMLIIRKKRALKAIKDLKEAEARIFQKIKKRMEELAKDPQLASEFEEEVKRFK